VRGRVGCKCEWGAEESEERRVNTKGEKYRGGRLAASQRILGCAGPTGGDMSGPVKRKQTLDVAQKEGLAAAAVGVA
jgi:vacuolar-type H+-ATPase catalytic subunit A/Vma1